MGHTRQGVGVASLPPAAGNTASRWVTWGLDESIGNVTNKDDLVVKVWESSSSSSKQTTSGRAPTVSTVSVDEEEMDGNEADPRAISVDTYRMTACKSMEGAAAARVHPLFPGE